MAYIETSPPCRLDWRSELPVQGKEVIKLCNDIRGKQESSEGITYDGGIQGRFKELDGFINNCALSV